MASVTSPSRVPFGVLDEGRLRNLTNIKNKQNAILPPSSSLGKRRYEPQADPALDAENLDPGLFNKKAKNEAGGFVKPQHFVLKPTAAGPVLTPTTRQTITPKRLAKRAVEIKPVSFSAPAAATAPAGRSPTRKRVGILSKRRTSGSNYTRVDPPAFGLGRNVSSGLPFSIDTALSGTVASHAPKPSVTDPVDTVMTLENNMPSSWVFEIHEDTPDEELGNLMQHSAEVLDISDDEERKARLLAEVGKENIAPPEYTGRQRAVARRDMMTEEVRTPLGDLKPADYYAEGCDANSFIIIEADKETKPATALVNSTAASEAYPLLKGSNVPPSPIEAGTANQDEWRRLLASVDAQIASKPAEAANEPPPEPVTVEAAPTELPNVEIWESESAHGDDSEPHDAITTTSSLEDSMAAASAHEEAALEAAS